MKKYSGVAIKNEIVYGLFNRSIILPISITDKKNVVMKYKNGMLVITIDKQKEEKNKFNITIGEYIEEVE